MSPEWRARYFRTKDLGGSTSVGGKFATRPLRSPELSAAVFGPRTPRDLRAAQFLLHSPAEADFSFRSGLAVVPVSSAMRTRRLWIICTHSTTSAVFLTAVGL